MAWQAQRLRERKLREHLFRRLRDTLKRGALRSGLSGVTVYCKNSARNGYLPKACKEAEERHKVKAEAQTLYRKCHRKPAIRHVGEYRVLSQAHYARTAHFFPRGDNTNDQEPVPAACRYCSAGGTTEKAA